MKKIVYFVVLVLGLTLVQYDYCYTLDVWEDTSRGIQDRELLSIAIDPQNTNTIYAGSRRSIFKTQDSGKTWKRIFSVKGHSTHVNAIVINEDRPSNVYAATQNGLFKSTNGGKTWRSVFQGVGTLQKDVRCILLDQKNSDVIYIGTQDGFFTSEDAGRTWIKSSGEISSTPINHMVSSPNSIFVAANNGIYELQEGAKQWKKIFTAFGDTADENSTEYSNESSGEEEAGYSNKSPLCLTVGSMGLYVGTNSGVFFKDHRLQVWNRMTTTGLTNNKISSLAILENGILYAATDSGVFKISEADKIWSESYRGIAAKNINFLTYNPANKIILAATDKGIYKRSVGSERGLSPINPEDDPEVTGILSNFDHEPTINEVLKAATRYAEVNAEKIQEWRKAAKRKALLPDLSVGVDHDTRETYEIYTSASKSYWSTGPENSSTGWDVTLRWDLGELIWNDDQTNIDVRSKLMVQLRDDILDEVTHLYFERRRLQIDLLTNPPKQLEDKLEKELRLQELTAGIDALTGGWFSKKIGESKG